MTAPDRELDREPRASHLPEGRVIAGRYEVGHVLGEGASGVVYLARERPSGAVVALKVIHRHLTTDRQIFGRFQREAAILKRLEGVHLVKLLDFLQEDGLLILALEHVEGVSLEAMLREKNGVVELAEAVEITLQVCAALGAAHAAGVVHRDLKPGNVLIERPSPDHPGVHVRVVDFGLAKVVHGEHMTTGLTEQDMIFGTPEYMAPEQARGDDVDHRCDLYAAGIMLYEMAVGRVPFDGRTPIAKMTAHLVEQVPPPRSSGPGRAISPALEVVILRALAKEPADRYPSARAFAEALSSARDEPLVIAPHRDADPASAIGDTDLQVATTGLAHSPTLPADEEEARGADPPRAEQTLRTAPVAAAGGSWLWIVVAVIAAAVGVAVGVIFGTR